MKVFAINVDAGASLKDLTAAVRDAVSQVYELKALDAAVVLRCRHMTNCYSLDEEASPLLANWEKALRQLEMSRAAIIFVADGDVFGHIFDLLLISDYRVLRSGARVGFSLQDGASLPGMSLYRVTNQIGQAHARRMALAGKTLEAQEACMLGLADELTEEGGESLERALDKFDRSPSSELAVRRRLILEAHSLEYDNALGAYLAACARNRTGASE